MEQLDIMTEQLLQLVEPDDALDKPDSICDLTYEPTYTLIAPP
jgi:hypothetical protein